jgi:hypothetical protein
MMLDLKSGLFGMQTIDTLKMLLSKKIKYYFCINYQI